MALVETVMAIAREQMQEIAETIEGELKSACPTRSGMARASIHIEQVDDTKYKIGADATFPPDGNDGGTHLYYSAYGNGGSGAIIKSKRKYDRRGKVPGKLKLADGSYAPYVRGYKPASNFIVDVANRHR